jgi:hypothetical protein
MPGWSEFESRLAYLNQGKIECGRLRAPDKSSSHEYDRDGVIWSMGDFPSKFRRSMDAALLSMVECVLASEEFSHIQSSDNRQFRSADFGQCTGNRFPDLCSGYTPLDCIPLTFVACGTASTE